MEISLENIDNVVKRTNVTYREAKDALEKNNGDVIEAIIYIEQKNKSLGESLSNKGDQLIDKVKEILKKGNVTKIIVKKDNEIIMNLPITAGIVGTIVSAPLALVGLGAAVLSKCSIEIVKEDGEVINVNKEVDQNIDEDIGHNPS